MADEFTDRRLGGAAFHRVDLTGADFTRVTFAGATFQSVDLSGIRMRNAAVRDAEINGDVESLRINGIDVVPLVEAELDRRHPERTKLRPTDADGFREAWVIIEDLWADTIDRASKLPEGQLHESVNGEWSFIETLRHLVFATDSWIGRVVLGEASPWHPLDLPWDEMPETPGVPRDRTARPGLGEVLELRRERMATVRRVFDEITDEQLDATTDPVDAPGWPPPVGFPLRNVLEIILNEE